MILVSLCSPRAPWLALYWKCLAMSIMVRSSQPASLYLFVQCLHIAHTTHITYDMYIWRDREYNSYILCAHLARCDEIHSLSAEHNTVVVCFHIQWSVWCCRCHHRNNAAKHSDARWMRERRAHWVRASSIRSFLFDAFSIALERYSWIDVRLRKKCDQLSCQNRSTHYNIPNSFVGAMPWYFCVSFFWQISNDWPSESALFHFGFCLSVACSFAIWPSLSTQNGPTTTAKESRGKENSKIKHE